MSRSVSSTPKTKPTDGHKKTDEREKYDDQLGRRRSLPFLNVIKDGDGFNIELTHEKDNGYPELAAALGTSDERLVRGLLTSVVNATMHSGCYDEDALNYIIAFIKDNAPRNSMEGVVLAHVAALSDMAFKGFKQVACTDNSSEREIALRVHSQVARTLQGFIETFRRLRTGGEQRVTVQHVSVNEGAQAVIANISQSDARDSAASTPATSPRALPDQQAVPMPPIDERQRDGVSSVHERHKRKRRDDRK